jgi:hypothetical protein
VGSIPTFGIMEIEDILMRNEQLVLENEALRQQIEDLKNGFEGCCPACEPVGGMNKKLREERDEARRLYCEELAFTIELERGEAGNPLDLAAEKGWGGLYQKEESDE